MNSSTSSSLRTGLRFQTIKPYKRRKKKIVKKWNDHLLNCADHGIQWTFYRRDDGRSPSSAPGPWPTSQCEVSTNEESETGPELTLWDIFWLLLSWFVGRQGPKSAEQQPKYVAKRQPWTALIGTTPRDNLKGNTFCEHAQEPRLNLWPTHASVNEK